MNIFNERYRPTSLKEFIGNQSVVTNTKQFIQNFPATKGLIYIGPPGTGKTTFALLLTELTKVPYSHVNASLMRKKDIEYLGQALKHKSLFHDRNIFILDEIDKLTKQQQSTLSKYIDESNQPVILIANYEEKLSKDLTKNCDKIYFELPTKDEILKRLEQISENKELIKEISDKADTIRSALNMLESGIVHDTEIEIETPWDALQMQVVGGADVHQRMSNSEMIVYLSDSNASPMITSMMDYYDGLNRKGGKLSGKAIKQMLKYTRVQKLTNFPRTWMLMRKYKHDLP